MLLGELKQNKIQLKELSFGILEFWMKVETDDSVGGLDAD